MFPRHVKRQSSGIRMESTADNADEGLLWRAGNWRHLSSWCRVHGMCLNVLIEISLLAVSLATDVAWKWLLAGMDLHVDAQTGGLGEALVAELALEGLFARVNPHVDVEAARLCEGAIADGTGEGFLPHMALHVLH